MTYLAVFFGIVLTIQLWGAYDWAQSGNKLVATGMLLATVGVGYATLRYFHAMHMLGVVLATIAVLFGLALWGNWQARRYERGFCVQRPARWVLR